jgi:hypothetical protein
MIHPARWLDCSRRETQQAQAAEPGLSPWYFFATLLPAKLVSPEPFGETIVTDASSRSPPYQRHCDEVGKTTTFGLSVGVRRTPQNCQSEATFLSKMSGQSVKKFRANATALAAVLLLASCAVGPDFLHPAAPDAAGYTKEPLAPQTSSANAPHGQAQRFDIGRDISAEWWSGRMFVPRKSVARSERAARFGVSPTMACSWEAPEPMRSPTTTRPVAIPTRVCRGA